MRVSGTVIKSIYVHKEGEAECVDDQGYVVKTMGAGEVVSVKTVPAQTLYVRLWEERGEKGKGYTEFRYQAETQRFFRILGEKEEARVG